MNLNDAENYVLIPDKRNTEQAVVMELKPVSAFRKNGFVLIPYVNPQKEKVEPLYFSISNKFDFKFPSQKDKQPDIQLKSKTNKSDYLKNILALKNHIQLGNIYELNYCIEFFNDGVIIDPLDVFLKLKQISKAPYSMLLKLGSDYIISASPELFLKKQGHKISTKPIKGTAKRGQTEAEDEELKNELYHSLKERTENVMAVDVARNDLSIFANKGTVSVNKLYNIETFETVHQMVSTVSCEIDENKTFEDLIHATFPMASMTGAPKYRAMTLIDEFENFKRGFYSGAMGLIDENGDFELSVIIRSIFYNQKTKRLSIAVGGAITYLSDPEKEYEECLLKAQSMLKSLGVKNFS